VNGGLREGKNWVPRYRGQRWAKYLTIRTVVKITTTTRVGYIYSNFYTSPIPLTFVDQIKFRSRSNSHKSIMTTRIHPVYSHSQTPATQLPTHQPNPKTQLSTL